MGGPGAAQHRRRRADVGRRIDGCIAAEADLARENMRRIDVVDYASRLLQSCVTQVVAQAMDQTRYCQRIEALKAELAACALPSATCFSTKRVDSRQNVITVTSD